MRTIASDRLLLRPWRDEDADFLLDLESRWEVVRFLGAQPRIMNNRKDALASIARRRAIDDPIRGIWAITTAEDSRLVGNLLLEPISRPGDLRESRTEQDMEHGTRDELLGRLAEAVGSVTAAHPTRVAIDGPPAAGKTTLADELAVVLRAQGRNVIRATIDDFLFPRAQRYPRGEYSAEGCYYDTHDHGALNRVLLDPLGPGGDRRFQPAVYDRTADAALSPPTRTAPIDAVLIFDGVFLMRPELIDRWDLRIFVSTALEKTVDRAVIRERRVSSRADVERRWRERYIPSQHFYFATVRPTDHVDIIVHNDEPQQPVWEARRH